MQKGVSMYHGFIKVAAATPSVTVADPVKNADEIIRLIRQGAEQHAKIIVFPALSLTAATCGDLFLQETLLEKAQEQLWRICEETQELDALIFVGLPAEIRGKLYSVAAVLQQGELLALVPQQLLDGYGALGEQRIFSAGSDSAEIVDWGDEEVFFGTNILFPCEDVSHLVVAAEVGNDFWAPNPPATRHAIAGASVICTLAAEPESVDKAQIIRNLFRTYTRTGIYASIYANAGEGESTTDLVFGGEKSVVENGHILAESVRFREEILITEIDVDRLLTARRQDRVFSATAVPGTESYLEIPFSLQFEETELTRTFSPQPFVPEDPEKRMQRCEEILQIQAQGLKKRLMHTHAEKAVLGISGGLDSTLALLVTVRTFDALQMPRDQILAVTMPGFGTTDRTYDNACTLVHHLGATLREIPIREAVTVHFQDIGQDPEQKDVTYENAQARERTQILMDLANQENGLVVGTGDLSELVLGWATYNGDHMSMYGVNGSVPKTLVRHLVRYEADHCEDASLQRTLLDILDTPVSPELLPTEAGELTQKTEELVGPYELHDFFLYYMLRAGYAPDKIHRIALCAFAEQYKEEEITHWLKVFYRRFFSQQFKRSCLPDGPSVGSVAISPRGGLQMPSDAVADVWLRELEMLASDA